MTRLSAGSKRASGLHFRLELSQRSADKVSRSVTVSVFEVDS